jgi:hypothetical protein
MNQALNSKATCLNLGHIGWRYYNQIRKKAMEQEFSWFGLLVNLSIAFFIVISSAFCLSCLQKSVEVSLLENSSVLVPQKVYHLEENFRSELSSLEIFNNLS